MRVKIGIEEFDCISADLKTTEEFPYQVITIDAVDINPKYGNERNEYGDWDVNLNHLYEMQGKFFETNRKVSHLRGGNDGPRHKGKEDIEVLFADDPFDGYVGVKILIFNTELYRAVIIEK